jgi:hypothetical protein
MLKSKVRSITYPGQPRKHEWWNCAWTKHELWKGSVQEGLMIKLVINMLTKPGKLRSAVQGLRRKMKCIIAYLPPLWSSGQNSCLQIHRSAFDSWHYLIFREIVGLERGPFSLVSTIEELLERKNSGSGLEIGEYGRRDPLRWPRNMRYLQTLTLTSPTGNGSSVDVVRCITLCNNIALNFECALLANRAETG